MRKILILKLTRMGDILEAAQLLRAIRRSEPTSRITLVVNETFRETAALLADVDQLLTFPIYDYARDLREGDEDLVDLYRRLEAFADRLSAERYDLALNVTNSQLSGVLMGFIRARQARGLVYDDQGTRLVSGPFIRYFGANDIRRFNPFNLSDFMLELYGKGGVPCDARLRTDEAASAAAGRWLEPVADRPLIGIQLGASEACKRWRIDDFAAVARRLLETPDAALVLLGSPDERPLADELRRLLGAMPQATLERLVDLVGRTSIAELAAVTGRLRVLVSNDTGTMHLAAALNVRVLNLSLGSAFFRETAPYGEGHLVLEPRIECRPCNFLHECSHFDCKRLLTPATVAGLALALLRGEDGLEQARAAYDRCDVYRTTFDEDGILHCARLVPRPLEADEVLMHVYRVAICQGELDGDFEARLEAGMRRLYADGRSLLPGVEPRLREALQQLRRLEQKAQDGIDQVERAMAAAHEGALEGITPLLGGISSLDLELAELGRDHVDVRFLTRAFLLEKEALRGSRLEVLLRGHRASYMGLKAISRWSQAALTRALMLLVSAEGHAEEASMAGMDGECGYGSWT